MNRCIHNNQIDNTIMLMGNNGRRIRGEKNLTKSYSDVSGQNE